MPKYTVAKGCSIGASNVIVTVCDVKNGKAVLKIDIPVDKQAFRFNRDGVVTKVFPPINNLHQGLDGQHC